MSREKKRQVIWYQIDDTEAIARHLEKMAAKGWLLEEVDNWYYTYRRAEPVQVKYTATFFPDASIYDPRPTEGQETYADYCQAAGWELAAVYGPIQYFRSTRPDPAPIETDESVRLTAVRRTMRKTFVFSYALLLFVGLIQLPVLLQRFHWEPLDFFSNSALLGVSLLMAALVLFGVIFLLDYFIWVLRSKHSVARGGNCCKPHTRFRFWFNMALLAVCAAALLGCFVGFEGLRTVLVIYLVIYGGIMLLGRWVLRRLKRSGASRGGIKGLFILFAIVAGLVVGFGTPFLFTRLADAGLIHVGREPAETYVSSKGSYRATRDIYHDELPVTLEDLGYTVTEDDHCSYKAEINRSPLAVHGEYIQEAMNWESKIPQLYYQTYEARWPWLLEKCWRELIKTEKDDPWPMQEVTPARWGAVETYRQKDLTTYCLLYPDRIITFNLGRSATAQQVDDIGWALAAAFNT